MRLRSTRSSAISASSGRSIDAVIAGIFSSATGLLLDAQIASVRYQDNTGTTPASAAGNVVGLMLDQSKALATGSEIVANGLFGSTASWAMAGGSLIESGKLNFVTLSMQRPYNSGGTLADCTKAHWFEIDFEKETSNFGVSPALYSLAGVLLSASPAPPRIDSSGHYKIFVPANATSSNYFVGFNRSAAYTGTCSVDNTTLKEVAGNHSTQATLSLKPKYQTGPQRIEFDLSDDALVVNFPVALGANCTVVYGAPGVGSTVLTGQTIGTTYSITQSFTWILISNRPLSAAESSACVARANQRSF